VSLGLVLVVVRESRRLPSARQRTARWCSVLWRLQVQLLGSQQRSPSSSPVAATRGRERG
jgi:hypothetical protein